MASKRIKGITIEIDGNATGLDKTLSGVNSNLLKTQNSLRDVERLLKIDPKNTELLAQKQKLLSQAVDETKTKLASLKAASEQAAKTAGNYDAWKEAYTSVQNEIGETQDKLKSLKQKMSELEKAGKVDTSEYKALGEELKSEQNHLEELKKKAIEVSDEFGNPISHEQYDALQREIIETEQNLRDLERQARESTSVLGTQMQEVGGKISEVGGKISDAGKKLLPVTVGITSIGAAAVKTAADFDSEMSKVSAVSGATGESLEKLRDKAREMGEKTKFSASEAAAAMNYMAMAGWKTEDMLSGIEGIMNLAAASGEELATTSDIVTDALTAFGLTAADSGHFADILAAASSNANTNVSMMGETFTYCAPIAGALGFSAEDTAEAIGLMANAGIKASQAGTALRSIMNNLTGEVKICGDNIGEVVIQTTNTDGSMRNLSNILADCRTAFSGLSESEKAAAAESLVGKYAMSGFLALMNAGKGDIEKLSDAIAGCDGAAANMADTMQDNLQGQVTILKSAVSEAAISIGEVLTPVIKEVVEKIQEWTEKFNSLSEGQKKTIVMIGAIVAAIAPLLIIIGTVVSTIGNIISGMGTLLTFLGGISGTVMAAVAAIGVLIAAIVHLWNTNEEFQNSITQIWEKVKAAFQAFSDGILERLSAMGLEFGSMTEVIKAVWDGFCNLLAPGIEAAFSIIATKLETAFNVILGIWDVFSAVFSGDWSGAWEAVKSIFSDIWDGVTDILKTKIDMLKGIADVFLGWFGTDWETVWDSVKTFFEDTWNGIVEKFEAIKETVNGIFEALKETVLNVWETIKNVVIVALMFITEVISSYFELITLPFRFIWENCKDTIIEIWENIKSKVTTVLEAIREVINTVWGLIKDSIATTVNTIKEVIDTVWGLIKDIITTVISEIKDVIESTWNMIKTTATNVWNMIKTAIEIPISAAKTAVSTAVESIKSTVRSVFDSVKTTVTDIWDDIKTAIEKPINKAKTAVQKAIDAIKKALDFKWELPKLKIPHFSITGKFSLDPPQVPHLDIQWYRNGGIMTNPTMFGVNGKDIMAGGEAGPEAILPLEPFYSRLSQILDSKLTETRERIVVEMPVYVSGNYTKTEIAEIAMKGISRSQKYNARGAKVNVRYGYAE